MSVLNTNTLAARIIDSNEKVTGPAAVELLRHSDISSGDNDDFQVLDNATGGGILVAELLRQLRQSSRTAAISRVVAGDVDEGMLDFVRYKKEAGRKDDPTWDRVEIMQIDQQSIPLPDDTFSHVFSNFGIFFCKDDEAAMKASYAIPALSAFLPEAPALPSPGSMFPPRGWSDPAAIPSKIQAVGFLNVQVSEHDFTPDIDPEDFAEAAGALVKVVATKIWSQEDTVRFANRIQPSMLQYALENFPSGRWDGKMTAIITLARKP